MNATMRQPHISGVRAKRDADVPFGAAAVVVTREDQLS
jgi:hypothetical protein